ncbi:MAG TPA: 1-(5-phosphoribosyl)-5-[(5-phosphoribosylamino)methylideneamino] imidazole-4-carboxamide isomerase [Gemmatimonadaceae bacterium]|jgi:phosphoribosylformimino-5-aminoimidazole carboxamide ribotide isomerase|nr:1-(5-phosphoribosyl)-5-[(5-phosphoribosylamino)methylideneamino] imidazole-4-carboxamide isomerase [Gemmatimonadaceae bacterium]
MIAIPALDLRSGACVQLAPGSYDEELIRIPDPVGVALAWRQYGFRHLHVVDLDGVAGRGNNRPQIHGILGATDVEVQVGGGIRNRQLIQDSLDDGARRVIIGTRAVEDPDWLADMAGLFPGFIVVAADVRDRKILSHGWTRTHPKLVIDFVEDLSGLPLAGLLVTAVHREAAMHGTDLPLMEDVAQAADFPVFAAGGLGSLNDLRALADRGVAAAILGMALYSGAIDPWVVAEEFAE